MLRITLVLAVTLCLYMFAGAAEEQSNEKERLKRYIGAQNFLPVLDKFMHKQNGFQFQAKVSHDNRVKMKKKNMSKMWKWWLSIMDLD